jgi:hypothetical protein
MVTRAEANTDRKINDPSTSREWLEFALMGYARICARKHGFVPPIGPLEGLSNEELDNRLALLRDLAHLPPG